MIKDEVLRGIEAEVINFFCDHLALEPPQHRMWHASMRALRAVLWSVYTKGVLDGLTAAGLSGRQLIALHHDQTALPEGYNAPPDAEQPALDTNDTGKETDT